MRKICHSFSPLVSHVINQLLMSLSAPVISVSQFVKSTKSGCFHIICEKFVIHSVNASVSHQKTLITFYIHNQLQKRTSFSQSIIHSFSQSTNQSASQSISVIKRKKMIPSIESPTKPTLPTQKHKNLHLF